MRSTPPLRVGALLMGLGVGLLLGLAGCTDDPAAGDGPHIATVAPDPVAPGEAVRIEGGGFGRDGYVSVDGRALRILDWRPSLIVARLAVDQRPGPTHVVVTTAGRPSAPADLTVAGAPVSPDDPPRVFPPSGDGGVVDRGPRDAGPPRDGGPPPDAEAPDLGGRVLQAEFSSDPVGDSAVFIEADTDTVNEVTLRIRAPRAWGVAFHLAYDRNLLRLLSASPADEARAHTAEIAPGRVAAGQAVPGTGPHVFTLRFALLGRGEGRVTFPARYRTRRDDANRPIETRWVEGSIRVREVSAP